MDGILVVDKPQGLTSHDVVDFVRKRFALKKVGHAGTLDPIATGVLVVLLGSFTRFFDRLSRDDKEYEATMILGATSDTDDACGKLTDSGKNTDFKDETIESAFRKFMGDIEQVPPKYCAIKYKGKKLYELARKGLTVELKPRKISIKRFDIMNISLPEISFRVSCSKGTYVRKLCADIGEALGCGAYMSQLRRTRSGKFNVSDAIALSSLNEFTEADLKKRLRNL